MSIHKSHLVAVTLGDAGDEVPHVAESGTDGGAGLTGSEPGFNLELTLSLFVGDELEIKVQVLEVAGKLASWSLNLDDLGVNLDLNPIGDVHGLGRQYGLHLCSLSLSLGLSGSEENGHRIQRIERPPKTLAIDAPYKQTLNPNEAVICHFALRPIMGQVEWIHVHFLWAPTSTAQTYFHFGAFIKVNHQSPNSWIGSKWQ